jgi:thiamine biosynthesis protein ThiS
VVEIYGRLAPPGPVRLVFAVLHAQKQAMNLTVNGETRAFSDVADVAALVSALGLDTRKVAVERNLEIVPRSAYAKTSLADGDRIEIVQFVGGG